MPLQALGASFQQEEDPLLATGIVLFGDDKEAICRHLLPTKTPKQVHKLTQANTHFKLIFIFVYYS
jgi:hypothetical protein